jgi:SAM-dependent methyltransferase
MHCVAAARSPRRGEPPRHVLYIAAVAAAPLPVGKPYYGAVRHDLVQLLPRPLGRVLDVGCSDGATGAVLREAGAESLTGIEIVPEIAERARVVYDEVHVGSADDVLESLKGSWDTIVCYDVLEHLVDPWRVLRVARRLAAPGARLHVSVPNARHLSLPIDLILHGTFGYTRSGHRDDAHLRWFTRRDMADAITNAGWSLRSVAHSPLSRARSIAGRLTQGHSNEFVVLQWYFLAVVSPEP